MLLYQICFRVHKIRLGTINNYALVFAFKAQQIKVLNISYLNADVVNLSVLV
jgi:hypothetical protein